MDALTTASIERYHEKTAGNFVVDWAKKNIKLPSKDKALKVLKKYIKDEKDVDALYAALPKMMSFLKGKKAMTDPRHDSVLPSGFINNMALVIAMISIMAGAFPENKDAAKDLLEKEKIIKVVEKKFQDIGYFRNNDYITRKINNTDTQEEMNTKVLRALKEKTYFLRSEHDKKFLYGTKDPLSFKLYRDKAGKKLMEADELKKHDGAVYIRAQI